MKDKLYIFFDIDGVLNCINHWSEKNFPLYLDCVKNFADTVNFFKAKYEVHLIMSSSWRDGFDLVEGHTEYVQDILDKLAQFNLTVEDKTPFFMQKNRADEINFYISEHNLQNYKCLAIDDAKSLFASPLAPNLKLYLTDAHEGFSRADYNLLTGQNLNYFDKLKKFLRGYNF